jgi:hypothetical protein
MIFVLIIPLPRPHLQCVLTLYHMQNTHKKPQEQGGMTDRSCGFYLNMVYMLSSVCVVIGNLFPGFYIGYNMLLQRREVIQIISFFKKKKNTRKTSEKSPAKKSIFPRNLISRRKTKTPSLRSLRKKIKLPKPRMHIPCPICRRKKRHSLSSMRSPIKKLGQRTVLRIVSHKLPNIHSKLCRKTSKHNRTKHQ